MDAFKILARGAKITGKHRDELKKFRQDPEEPTAAIVERKLDFFSNQSTKKVHQKPKPAKKDQEETPQWINKPTKTKVSGHDAPAAVDSFESLDDILARNLDRLGYKAPTPIQSESLPILMGGRDLLACAPTGSGKTLAFIAPLLHNLCNSETNGRTRAVVVSPTRELASQTYEIAVRLAKGTNLNVVVLDRAQIAKLRNKNAGKVADLLISTPLRLVETVNEGLVDLSGVNTLILDEADRLLGDGFVEQTDEIVAACSNPKLTKAVFSATLPSNVEELAQSIMNSPLRVIIGHKEAASSTIEQKLVYCGNEAGKLTAIRQMLKAGDVVPPILVFVQSIARAKALFHELLYDKVNVDVIHSELSQNQRDKVVANYKQGDIWVLVCTDVLARGIDFHGVNLVINYDIPLSAQAYVHRIGRTGRAGRQGKAVTFFSRQDTDSIRAVANVMKQSGCEVPDWLLNSKKQKQKIPVARDEISTVPSAIKRKRNDRREMINASKRRTDAEREKN